MKKINHSFWGGLGAANLLVTAGLLAAAGLLAVSGLAACAPRVSPAQTSQPPAPTVSPLPALSSPVFIPTVTSAPAVSPVAIGSATLAPAASTSTPLPEPLFGLSSGDALTITHIFSAGTEQREYDGQAVQVGKELTITFTSLVSHTAQVRVDTIDLVQADANATVMPATDGDGLGAITPETLQKAKDKLGFAVLAPSWLPPGYTAGALGLSYSPAQKRAWQQYYASWGTRKFVWLEFSQQRREVPPIWNPVTGMSDVGSSAQIQAVQVRGQPAEYVSGGWVRTTTTQTADGLVFVTQAYQWGDPDPLSAVPSAARLRWVQDGFWFEIVFHGECWQYLCGSQETLIKIAEGLQ